MVKVIKEEKVYKDVESLATEVVIWMYENYPEYGYFDERDTDDGIILLFDSSFSNEVIDKLNKTFSNILISSNRRSILCKG